MFVAFTNVPDTKANFCLAALGLFRIFSEAFLFVCLVINTTGWQFITLWTLHYNLIQWLCNFKWWLRLSTDNFWVIFSAFYLCCLSPKCLICNRVSHYMLNLPMGGIVFLDFSAEHDSKLFMENSPICRFFFWMNESKIFTPIVFSVLNKF